MTANDAIVNLVNYLEVAQSRGIFSLREARDIANSIDVLAAPAPAPETPENKEGQDSDESDLQEVKE
ncbi:MAG: hypothetical protein P8J32_05945 [bacterium]|nr:hypothetical protein [bacterium]